MNINLQDCKTPAQAITKICYNESTRNLNFRVRCENMNDLWNCLSIIDSYNDFDAVKIIEALDKLIVTNDAFKPKNGREFFTFEIGRENSPVLYVMWSSAMRKVDTSEVKRLMRSLGRKMDVDESGAVSEDAAIFFEHRFWWG